METAVGESTYPVLGLGQVAPHLLRRRRPSPLRPPDMFHGHLLFTTMRLVMNCAVFLVVMAAFGAIKSPWVLAALPVAVLTGLAFATPIEAWAITVDQGHVVRHDLPVRHDPAVPVLRHVLPGQPAARLGCSRSPTSTPLWHGVALCRSLSLGTATIGGDAHPRRLPGGADRRRASSPGTGPTGGGSMSSAGVPAVQGAAAAGAAGVAVLARGSLGGRGSRHLVERHARVYRQAWLVLISGFFEPLFYLLAIGVGLGKLVGTVAGPAASRSPTPASWRPRCSRPRR